MIKNADRYRDRKERKIERESVCVRGRLIRTEREREKMKKKPIEKRPRASQIKSTL